jgi:hypothetical protein
MANIIFPINPATGSEYLAPENGATYVFNGDRWVIFGQNLNGLATTGSNELSGSQYISGSVIIEGNLLTFAGGSNIIMTSGSLGYEISVDPVFIVPVEIRNDFMNGNASVSPGSTSHAEGNQSTSVGPFSHAEGFNTQTLGVASHAEGDSTTTVGSYSHAEGNLTTTVSDYSHAEGIGTIANAQGQHVEGIYNVEDNTAVWLVGGGSGDIDRVNIIAAYPTGSGAATILLPTVSQSLDFADDTAAATGGVPLGGVYRIGNTLSIRII